MARHKVLVTDKIDKEGLATLEKHPAIDLRFEVGPTPEKLEKALNGVSAWLVRSESKVSKDWISKAPELRLIGRAGVGVDNIDIEAATLRGIAVINAPSANTIAACEHAFGMMLSLARNIPQADADVKQGRWQRSKWMGAELYGKTLGILGLGRIGRELAKRTLACGMRIVAHDPFVSKEQAKDMGVELGTIAEVLERADYISLHAPSTEKTRGMINADSLKLVKNGARLVNCARGDLIDEAALIEALKDGRLKGAALDVFSKEPLAEGSPLRDLPNVILTPHLGASTKEAQSRVASELSQGVIDFFERGIAANALNLPGFDPDTLKSLGELLSLSENLGRFAGQMIDSGLTELKCEFQGEFTPAQRTPLSIAALKGLLSTMLAQGVSYINAPMLASSRGIKTSVSADPVARDGYKQMLAVTAVTEKGATTVCGSMISPGKPRIVRVNELQVEVLPEGKMIVLVNKDIPGVIGKVGVLLGEAAINIADMRVGRRGPQGDAVMVLTVDSDVPADVQKKLEGLEGISQVRWVRL